ncbi:hypothetical protein HMPREF9374_3561 [Desmospora sp. 8437]|nr:hypothetical protein HMPREF9374_3561 [Desmospora sp. 8437]
MGIHDLPNRNMDNQSTRVVPDVLTKITGRKGAASDFAMSFIDTGTGFDSW